MTRDPNRTVGDYQARFEEDRARLAERHRGGEGGGIIVRAYRRIVDGTVRALCSDLLADTGDCAVIATGGYGRGELAFASDVDIQLLYACGQPPEGARPFIQALWDLGWEVGHQVVPVEEAVELASGDRETLTSYLEMRTVWGEKEITETLDSRIRQGVLKPRIKDYLSGKAAELERRHAEAGDTVYLSEPDIKQSPGGLRDLHTLLWMSNANGGSRNWRGYLADQHLNSLQYHRLQGAYDLTWRVRNTLHLLKGRPWDRLDHRSQSAVAGELGYGADSGRLPVEVFMRDYYRASREIYAFTRLQLASGGWVHELKAPAVLMVLGPEGEEAETWPASELLSAPLAILERFRFLARRRSSVSAETAAYLYEHGRSLGSKAVENPEHGRLFMEIMEGTGAAWSLHAMHQLGVLGGILPEFERLTALVQFDPYHHYTADEHTMRMLDALEALLNGAEKSEHGIYRQVAEVIDCLPIERWNPSSADTAILRLAVLLHDVGKGTGGSGHAERGARVVRKVGERLNLDRDALADVVFLVRHHLLLNAMAQRRDISEEVLLKRLRRLIRTPERLHMLALLTVADLAALSPTALTPWKCRLLVDLVESLEGLMAGEIPWAGTEIWDELLEELDLETRERVSCFLRTMPPEYGRDLDTRGLVADAALMESYLNSARKPETVVTSLEHDTEASRITLVTQDREGLLSLACGLFAAYDVTILHARIFTRLDNLVFDRFTVADAGSGGAMNEEQVDGILRDLPGALTRSVDVEALLKAHRERWKLRDRPSMEYPVKVVHDRAASKRYTVIEVRARDHVGLLHDIAATMAEMGISIHQAFISTEGERAVDAFYVTDPLGAPLDPETSRMLIEELLEVLTAG